MQDLVAELERDLRGLGSDKRARGEKAYLKSSLVHFGVPMPIIRKRVRATPREVAHAELIAVVEALWARGIHELRVAAIELMLRHLALVGAEDVPLVERMLREAKSWAYVDVLSAHIMGDLVVRAPKLARTLDRWARDGDFWIRRSAMLSLLVPLRRGEGDFDRFARYADAMLDEQEFFIRKAIGWILREVGRKRPKLVYDWLVPRAARASGVTMREALKPLSAAQRAKLTASRGVRPRRAATAARAR